MSGPSPSAHTRASAARAQNKMPLTPRQTQICALMAEGLTNKEIADRLQSSPWTIGGHIKQIFHRLRARNRAHAVGSFLKLA